MHEEGIETMCALKLVYGRFYNDGVELLLVQYLVQQCRLASCLGNPEFVYQGITVVEKFKQLTSMNEALI